MDELDKIPTDADMLAKWYAKQFRRLDHLYKVLHTEHVVDLAQCKQQENTLRKQVNEYAKSLEMYAAKTGEMVERMIETNAELALVKSQNDALIAELTEIKSRQDRHGTFLNTLRKKGETE